MSLFATKSIDKIIAEAAETGEHTLKKTLSALDLTMLGIGAIIGTGIFVLTGQAAGKHAGPAVVISMIVAGIASAFAALCYSEFAASVPISGSAYAYGYGTLGEFIAWIIGWDLILEYAFGAATVAVGWSGYVVSLFRDTLGIPFPLSLSAPPGVEIKLADGTVAGTGVFNLPAFLIAIAVTLLLIRGIKESASFNSAIVLIKVLVVVLFIIAGIGFVNMDNLGIGCQPGSPGCAQFMPFGPSGVITGAAVIFFAYIGFDAVSTAAQEAKNPQRDMPIGILGSLAICTVLYILVSGIMVGLVDYRLLTNAAAPIATAIDAAKDQAAGTTMGNILIAFPTIIKIGAVLGLSSTMVVMVMGQPRVFYSMSKDGLLPSWAAKIHPKFRTPHITTAITGVIVAVLAGFVPIHLLGELVSIGTLFAFVIVGTGIIILRASSPNLHRPFKVPLSPIVPMFTVWVSAFLMNNLPLDTWLRLIVWMSIGLVVYFAYSYKHSKLADVEQGGSTVESDYKPPIAAILAIIGAILLTIWQVEFFLPNTTWLDTAVRSFAWGVTGILVAMLMYGKKDNTGARSAKVRTVGLIASTVNLLFWIGMFYWFLTHWADYHTK
ncbi:MAG: amino acid permease [Acidobacteria bacterium]|nr:amino acid permease [Acidobacteriota bacterium]MBK8813918.1 amino acid permease [Acidobacteriota bacterium]